MFIIIEESDFGRLYFDGAHWSESISQSKEFPTVKQAIEECATWDTEIISGDMWILERRDAQLDLFYNAVNVSRALEAA